METAEKHCPCCGKSFAPAAIEAHLSEHLREIDALPTTDVAERLCKLDDCGRLALHRVTVSATCAHEQAGPSELCEEHKTIALHPSWRVSCASCLDDYGSHQKVFVSGSTPIYREMTPKGT